jgi:hypothetical protein
MITCVTTRWSPYFANPPFVVVREVRRAATVAFTNSLIFSAFCLKLDPPQGGLGEALVGGLAIAGFFGVVLTGLGLWIVVSKSKAAARRINQPLVVVWPGRRKP